jgi:hypothetical protein
LRHGKLKATALSLKDNFSLVPLQGTPKENVMKIISIAQSSLAVLLALLTPVHSFAATSTEAPYCIAVNGGFGGGGSTFVARNFSMPEASKCTAWTGYTKTASTVIFTTFGAACLSSDSTALTVSVSSADPDFLGAGVQAADYIKMTRTTASNPFSGQDIGYLTGSAEQTKCTSALLSLPAYHD